MSRFSQSRRFPASPGTDASYETTAGAGGVCRVCGLAIAIGTPMLYRSWGVERAHVACGWLRPDEYSPHEVKGGELRSVLYEWACPVCFRDVVAREVRPDRRCRRCVAIVRITDNENVCDVHAWPEAALVVRLVEESRARVKLGGHIRVCSPCVTRAVASQSRRKVG